jgi:hypothetical protein
MFRAFKKKQIEEQDTTSSYGLKQYNKYIYDPNPMPDDTAQERLINQFVTRGYTYITKLSQVYQDATRFLSTQDEDFTSFCFNAETYTGINTEGVVKNLDSYPAVFYFIKNDNILHSTLLFNVREHDSVYIDSFCVNQLKKLKGGREVLEEFMNDYKIDKVFHAELDNMLYIDLEKGSEKLFFTVGEGINVVSKSIALHKLTRISAGNFRRHLTK